MPNARTALKNKLDQKPTGDGRPEILFVVNGDIPPGETITEFTYSQLLIDLKIACSSNAEASLKPIQPSNDDWPHLGPPPKVIGATLAV